MLQLTLCPDIPPQMRAAIRKEHGMESDLLRIGPLPKALVQYVGAEYTHRRYEGYELGVWRRNESEGPAT